LGHTGYVRNRELEFSQKGTARAELLPMINATIEVVQKSLANLPGEKLQQQYPVVVFDKPVTVEHMLIHLTVHLGYHLGQINYHRRILTAG
jgi:uncharacterized damage-inducible protein DinB